MFLQEAMHISMILIFECAILSAFECTDVSFLSRFTFVLPAFTLRWMQHQQIGVCVFVHLFSFSEHFIVNCFLNVFQMLVQC